MNEKEVELHMNIVNWLMENRISFTQAMAIVSYAIQMQVSIPAAYVGLESDIKDKGIQ